MTPSSKTRPNAKGVSLLELLVAMTLLSLVTGLMVSVYLLGNRYLNRTQILSRLQQQASQAIYKLSFELSASTDANSTLKAISVPTPGVWFLSSQNDTGTYQYNQINGAQVWQRWICYYLEPSSSNLYRAAVPLTSTDNCPPFTGLAPTASLAVFQSPSVTQRSLCAENVSDLKVAAVGPSLYQVSVSCRMVDRENKEWVHTLNTQIYLQQTD